MSPLTPEGQILPVVRGLVRTDTVENQDGSFSPFGTLKLRYTILCMICRMFPLSGFSGNEVSENKGEQIRK
jgi:hypothetical protein